MGLTDLSAIRRSGAQLMFGRVRRRRVLQTDAGSPTLSKFDASGFQSDANRPFRTLHCPADARFQLRNGVMAYMRPHRQLILRPAQELSRCLDLRASDPGH